MPRRGDPLGLRPPCAGTRSIPHRRPHRYTRRPGNRSRIQSAHGPLARFCGHLVGAALAAKRSDRAKRDYEGGVTRGMNVASVGSALRLIARERAPTDKSSDREAPIETVGAALAAKRSDRAKRDYEGDVTRRTNVASVGSALRLIARERAPTDYCPSREAPIETMGTGRDTSHARAANRLT